MPDGFVPVEGTCGGRHSARPQHPCREDAVEERLHQRGAEEGRAALTLETDAERLLQRRTHRRQRGRVARRLDPRQTVARVRGEQPGQVLRLGQRGAMRQGPAEIFAQTGPDAAGKRARRLQQMVELLGVMGQPEGLELCRQAVGVLAHQHEIAGVGYQDQSIAAPVAADLIAVGGQPGVVIGGLDLDYAAFGDLPFAHPAPLHLPGGVEAQVGMAGAVVGQFADAEDLGLEHSADGVEEGGQRRIRRPLAGRAAGSAQAAQVAEVRLDRRR